MANAAKEKRISDMCLKIPLFFGINPPKYAILLTLKDLYLNISNAYLVYYDQEL